MIHEPPTMAELNDIMDKMPKPTWHEAGTLRTLGNHTVAYRMPDCTKRLSELDQPEPHIYPTLTLTPHLYGKRTKHGYRECVVWEYNGPVIQELPQ